MYFCMTKSTKSHLRRSLLEISLSFPALPKREHHNPPVRTYRVNRPTAGKDRSAGSNARVVCSTLLCAMPIYGRGSHFADIHFQHLGSVSAQTSYTPATPLYAGVEPAHTRICSATSCDVFARVVWIKLWGKTDLTILLCPPPALACHARFLRLSRVCGRSLKEESLPLFVLFGQAKSTFTYCYFSDKRKVHPFIVTFPMD